MNTISILDNGNKETVIGTLLENTTEPFYLLRPSPQILDSVVRLARHYTSPTIHVLAEKEDLLAVRRQFSVATHTAELINNGQLTVTPRAPSGRGSFIITEGTVNAIASIDEHTVLLETEHRHDELIKTCTDYQGTESFDLRTPAWNQVTGTIEDSFDTTVRDDFITAVETWGTELESTKLDESGIAVLVAAQHELLFYDISKWGEDIKLSSRATFSRVKRELEEKDIIECEKVPLDIGRPRLRLTIGEKYASLSIPELLHEVATVLTD